MVKTYVTKNDLKRAITLTINNNILHHIILLLYHALMGIDLMLI